MPPLSPALVRCIFVFLTCSAAPLGAAPPEVNWEEANARRMFVLTNDGDGIAAIVLDTTRPEDLRAAIKLQELVYRISSARMSLVDREFVGDRWGTIRFAWDYSPMTPREHRFVIEMQQAEPAPGNPRKQIIIAGAPPAKIEEAVSAFTKAAFDVPLEALEDDKFKWYSRKTLAIPEGFGPIYPDRPKRKAGK